MLAAREFILTMRAKFVFIDVACSCVSSSCLFAKYLALEVDAECRSPKTFLVSARNEAQSETWKSYEVVKETTA